jgi:hypothetical protein
MRRPLPKCHLRPLLSSLIPWRKLTPRSKRESLRVNPKEDTNALLLVAATKPKFMAITLPLRETLSLDAVLLTLLRLSSLVSHPSPSTAGKDLIATHFQKINQKNF